MTGKVSQNCLFVSTIWEWSHVLLVFLSIVPGRFRRYICWNEWLKSTHLLYLCCTCSYCHWKKKPTEKIRRPKLFILLSIKSLIAFIHWTDICWLLTISQPLFLTWDTVVNKSDKDPTLMEVTFKWMKQLNKYKIIIITSKIAADNFKCYEENKMVCLPYKDMINRDTGC